MQPQSLLQRIANLPTAPSDAEQIPPVEVTAYTIHVARKLKGWKQRTLADFANVSVSTIERAERAKAVSIKALDQIAVALGYPTGYFTTRRRPRTPEEISADGADAHRYLEPVAVSLLTTQRQVRALSKCHMSLIHAPDVREELADAVAQLNEWLDLTGFVISDLVPVPKEDAGRRRELYRCVLDHVRVLNAQGLNVIAGTLELPHRTLGVLKIAIVEVTSRTTDPGAAKRNLIFFDRRSLAGLRWGDAE
jgi:transcriptional regulator with XRE-family HTH domain